MNRLAIAACFAALCGCTPETDTIPPPTTLTAEAAGHFCQMIVLDHPGPKAQVHLAGHGLPLWFSQVRDAIAFQRQPERDAEITAIYVNDMGAAPSWREPGIDNWIDAASAVYVVGSAKRGGMGAPEAVPFAQNEDATEFAALNGGTVLALDEITDDMVLGPVEVDLDLLREDLQEGEHG